MRQGRAAPVWPSSGPWGGERRPAGAARSSSRQRRLTRDAHVEEKGGGGPQLPLLGQAHPKWRQARLKRLCPAVKRSHRSDRTRLQTTAPTAASSPSSRSRHREAGGRRFAKDSWMPRADPAAWRRARARARIREPEAGPREPSAGARAQDRSARRGPAAQGTVQPTQRSTATRTGKRAMVGAAGSQPRKERKSSRQRRWRVL